MTANLFDKDAKPKRRKRLQYQLLDYLREGKTITEEIFKNEIGGKSVSAAIHNLSMRGHFKPDEFIVNERVFNSEGNSARGYRLAKEAPLYEDESEKEKIEDLHTSSIREPEIGASDFAEDIGDDKETPESLPSHPEVESIYVGVRGAQPELVINFKGVEYMPLRHVMTPIEVRYLITNLMAFIPTQKDET